MSRKFVSITKEELLAKVDDLYRATLTGEDRDYSDREAILDSYTPPGALSAQIEKDLAKVEFDCENVAYHRDNVGTGLNGLVGLHVLPNGMPYVGVMCGGDWEEPVFMILYWDGKAVRGYVPKDGNCWNHNTKTAIGNDEEADAKFLKRYIREHRMSSRTGQKPTTEELEDFDEEVKDLGAQDLADRIYSPKLVLADIQARILTAGTLESKPAIKAPKPDIAPVTEPNAQVKELPQYIAVDFDGTCVTHEYPEVGRDVGAVPVLRELAARGCKLILFTMRSDDRDDGSHPLQDAVDWFARHDIPLFGVNRNPTQDRWTSSPKAYAQLYLDDASFGAPLVCPEPGSGERPYLDWTKVREVLLG